MIAMARSMDALNANHQQLFVNADSHDAQFAVLARKLLRLEAKEDSYPELIQQFKEFHEFREHPDFMDHLEEWYKGVPLSDMKLAPIPKEDAAPETDGVPQPSEDTAIFGGDYVKSEGGDVVPTAEPVADSQQPEVSVSEVQDANNPVAGPEVGKADATVSELPTSVS